MNAEHPTIRVLVVDDEEAQRTALAGMISFWGYGVEVASDGLDALDKLAAYDAHIMITDLNMPRLNGQELLRRIKAEANGPISIVLTAFGNLETAVSLVHELGAFWYLEKPPQALALRLLLERAAKQGHLAARAELLERQLSYQGVLGEMIGPSSAMQEVFGMIRQVAPSRAAVLITGESGTGKELAARAIHALSPRASAPFVALNCAAMPDTLMESELFGHEKGAFAGAVARRVGVFELAQNGTVFLDEVGGLPVTLQAKLLRVLEDGRIRRLFSKSETQCDVRIVAAASSPLDDAISEGTFREDLYYRLNVFPISLPPLRDRKDDLRALSDALLNGLNRKHDTKVTDVADAVLDRFGTYMWPGNVRELRNVLERAVIVAGEGTLLLQHLPPGFGTPKPNRVLGRLQPDELRMPVGCTIGQAERELIDLTIRHANGDRARAAEILGISRKMLADKLTEYESGAPRPDSPHAVANSIAKRVQRVFVLMPFSVVLKPVYEDHIKPTTIGLGLECDRADNLVSTGPIMDQVVKAIHQADVIVADCTGRNVNVFYEIGIAHTLSKETILIAQSTDDIPFDLQHLRFIIYTFTPRGMSEFEKTLKNTLHEILGSGSV